MKKRMNSVEKFNKYGIFLIIIQGLLLLAYGGFFEGSIAFCALALSLMFIGNAELKLEKYHIMFLIFSLWYFFCSIKSGFITEYAIRGLLPLICFLLFLIISQNRNLINRIIDFIIEISLWICILAIIKCIVSSIENSALVRITYPFDYSNTSGIYFAVCFICAENSTSKFLNRCKYIFLAGLLLTQSVGAVGIFVTTMLLKLIRGKKYIHTLILISGVFIFAFLLKDRIAESIGTFMERLLHIYDGFTCMIENPVFGIGAGQWENAKHYYQSGFYNARVLHSSIMAIGVNSGITGLLLFLTSAFLILKNSFKHNAMLTPAVMIIIHSFLDLSLSFMAINLMLILFLESRQDAKSPPVVLPAKCSNISAAVLSFGLIFLLIGNFVSASYTKNIGNMEPAKAVNKFENSFFLKSSVRSNQYCAALLYAENEKTAVEFRHFKFLPTELLIYEFAGNADGNPLIAALKKQPYNTAILDIIEQTDNESALKEAKNIVEKALNNASCLGKKIYTYQGEEL